MTDPWYRQSMVSQGTFIESPVLALHCSPNGALGRNAFPSRAVLALAWPPPPHCLLTDHRDTQNSVGDKKR